MSKDFIDQTFKVYKSNRSLPLLSESQLELIKTTTSRFLYQTVVADDPHGIKSSLDLLPDLEVLNYSKRFQEYTMTLLNIRYAGLLPRQTFFFVHRDGVPQDGLKFRSLALIRSTNSTYLGLMLQVLQSFDYDVPLVIKDMRLSDKSIKGILNELVMKLHSVCNADQVLGDTALTYDLQDMVSNGSLRNIVIDVPQTDLSCLITEEGFVRNLNLFLKKSSALDFDLLPLSKVTSRLINMSSDGKLKVHGENLYLVDNLDLAEHGISQNPSTTDAIDQPIIWFIILSIYNETNEH
ncbi:Piso0_002563 [Millerozyma farinosa CBS 7064]|uniref:Piso0_002563 protein n=1 Tax=Pichia sorbitophila (strain ATCC MYA-4447 / BCRC 22081 / CBS 7064 / NBRC 10061 / NRRL Y-12695) TaxID=559304 RepID=G8YCY2_PICSO|nr:Piso0_002563 [Millerozyma farinosa CBS 7064]